LPSSFPVVVGITTGLALDSGANGGCWGGALGVGASMDAKGVELCGPLSNLRSLRTISSKRSGVHSDLCIQRLAPASYAALSIEAKSPLVSTITGRVIVAGFDLIDFRTIVPGTLGSIRSNKTKSGWVCFSAVWALSPSGAIYASKPSFLSSHS
jgi:hypothetical protein